MQATSPARPKVVKVALIIVVVLFGIVLFATLVGAYFFNRMTPFEQSLLRSTAEDIRNGDREFTKSDAVAEDGMKKAKERLDAALALQKKHKEEDRVLREAARARAKARRAKALKASPAPSAP